MTIRYSVIIPVYNQANSLLFTLTSFKYQSYPKDRFEVIVVNDGSTDRTLEVIRNFASPYRLTCLSTHKRKGRSAARNLGAKEAKGRYLIFCDADFLVLPNFIEVHSKYHAKNKRLALSGVPNCWKRVYTQYNPDFSEHQKGEMCWLLSRSGLWKDSFWKEKRVVNVVGPEQVCRNKTLLEQVRIPWEIGDDIKKEYRKTDVAPWLLFVTRCVSVRKKHFDKVGGFDERFVKYGLEDWELGYRLHKYGLSFVSMDETIGCHQEHPDIHRSEDNNLQNLRIVYRAHGLQDPELALMAKIPPWSDVKKYKKTLRALKKGKETKKYQKAAQILEDARRIARQKFGF